ncbi:30S ribosomal protein S7 [archaeon]|jgi:small subunit ribosomal protein S7|nr:30S ribosomal protein S7 [archaeon]MBT3577577.1 30S ribosomal protein S7 [archaeon]MBT6820086.1 30S ribosomal protein S7 [archaeon]MBT6956779.1 30S ribosomal protein S7 [archaeon]MBT7025312.1 30S ribosomal protein S7 [archaeon]
MVQMKIFGLFDASEVRVEDPGLKKVVNLNSKLMLKSHGRIKWDPARTKVNVVERLINLLQVPGSRGKKHRIITSWITGKQARCTKIVIDAFKIIEKKTGENPLKVFVKAIENGSPRDEVTAIEYGGARYPQAVDVSPRRRLNLVLRYIANGSYDKAFNKKATIVESLAKEIMAAAEGSSESYAISKRNDAEKQADAAR